MRLTWVTSLDRRNTVPVRDIREQRGREARDLGPCQALGVSGLVVRLVTKAMEVLAAADHALYADDADLVAALLDGATTALSDQDHAEALQLGRDMTLDELARETHGALGDVVGLVGAAPSDETS